MGSVTLLYTCPEALELRSGFLQPPDSYSAGAECLAPHLTRCGDRAIVDRFSSVSQLSLSPQKPFHGTAAHQSGSRRGRGYLPQLRVSGLCRGFSC